MYQHELPLTNLAVTTINVELHFNDFVTNTSYLKLNDRLREFTRIVEAFIDQKSNVKINSETYSICLLIYNTKDINKELNCTFNDIRCI